MAPISLDGVWLEYRPRGCRGRREAPRCALRDVSIEIGAGERVGIIGANGSGKSSLLRLAVGILSPDRGEARVPQLAGAVLDLTPGPNRDLSGFQALEVYAAVDGMPSAIWRRQRDAIVAATQLDTEVLSQSLSTYSLGMLLRLNFAVVTVGHRDAVAVDEVMSAADETYREWAMSQLAGFAENGAAVVLASHDDDLLRQHADRVVVLDQGTIQFVGSPDAAFVARHEIQHERVAAHVG
jgi:ABC-type polysaccharide/polyol phosphate transport system ATPase subunit